jgi:ubiquinol-cytochrome c reductase cytochrome c1 subunit
MKKMPNYHRKFSNMNKVILILLSIIFFALNANAADGGHEGHSNHQLEPKQLHWEFDGIFGNFDRRSAQRGFQVWKEVCSACHSLERVAYRNLGDLGFTPEEIKAVAESATVIDGPNDEGEMFERPGKPSDLFVSPYPNEQAARAANGGRYPVDHSLIVKARPDGANYIYSLLTGYRDAPQDMQVTEGTYYNPYFTGNMIGMAPPLSDDIITYQDGTPATIDQMARDVVVFMQWAAEPEMEQRKSMGIKVMLYLIIFTVIFYFAKKAIWARIEEK